MPLLASTRCEKIGVFSSVDRLVAHIAPESLCPAWPSGSAKPALRMLARFENTGSGLLLCRKDIAQVRRSSAGQHDVPELRAVSTYRERGQYRVRMKRAVWSRSLFPLAPASQCSLVFFSVRGDKLLFWRALQRRNPISSGGQQATRGAGALAGGASCPPMCLASRWLVSSRSAALDKKLTRKTTR